MHNHELPIPSAAAADAKARELVRVWAASGKQHLSLAADLWDDPASWGIMLVDLARHLARAYGRSKALDENEALARIRAGMDAEWAQDTDPNRTGGPRGCQEEPPRRQPAGAPKASRRSRGRGFRVAAKNCRHQPK
ncbi:MAG: DUF5076 domain-containing protein [Gemmataceae bacterium]